MRKQRRRQFLQTSALAGVGFWAAGGGLAVEDRTAAAKIRFACIGVGGVGNTNTNHAARNGDVVALCDVDENTLGKAAVRLPAAKKYHDFRKLLDEMGKSIDAVIISTPNHTHAVIAATAIGLGKHCFIEKPLTRTIFEA